MKVSVATVTYNHERFLGQALDSALAQKTDFPFEIVVAEDCSTDGTRAVAKAYAERHPERIRLLLPEKNLGLTRNTAETLTACRGEYIAILEGDDFWIHDEKLQRQADFLDANPDCAWCFTRAIVVNADGAPVDAGIAVRTVKPKYTLGDYLERQFQPRFCTVMFRHRLFSEFPEWFFKMATADLPLHVFNTMSGGLIGFIDEEMSAYRIHPGGVWSQGLTPGDWAAESPDQLPKLAKRFDEMTDLYQHVDAHLGGAHRTLLRQQIAAFARKLTEIHESLGDRAAMRRSALIELRALGARARAAPLLALARSFFPMGNRSSAAAPAVPSPKAK